MTSNLLQRYIVIFLIIGLAVLCIVKNEVTLGIDLRGGSVLTYRVEKLDDAMAQTDPTSGISDEEIDDTIDVISQRINKEGVKDIAVRRLGRDIEIVLPEFTKQQVDEIRKRMTQVGKLEMPIVAQDGDEAYGRRFNKTQFENERKQAGEAGRPYESPKGFRWYPRRPEKREKEIDSDYAQRLAAFERKRLEEPWNVEGEWFYYKPKYWDPELVVDEGNPGFSGRDIYDVRRGYDQKGGRAVNYRIKEARQIYFKEYTTEFKGRQKALVLNGELWSAATIEQALSDNVQIHRGGGGYTEDEQKWLVNCLQSGSLKLRPVLLSQEEVGASLGQASIKRGTWAFIIGGIFVVAFMLIYYRMSGLLAVIALAINFLLVFGVLMLLQASLTLPGIAGLVLTVGMAVDANILIFERIREEIGKGKKLVHAAKNGFDRAFVTIFDANLTTFIVAAFLVMYGKGPIRGFGYTLMTGIVCSMFASLYITRTLLGTGLAKGWVGDLKMMHLLSKPNVNFAAYTKKAATISVIVVALGLVVSGITGDEKYGLDFNGGTSARIHMNDLVGEDVVKDAISQIKDESGRQKYTEIAVSLVEPEGGKSRYVDVKLNYLPPEDAGEAEDGIDPYEAIQNEIETVLAGKLAPETITDESYDKATSTWSAVLNLDKPITDQAVVLRLLSDGGLPEGTAVKADSAGLQWKLTANVQPAFVAQAPAKLLTGIGQNTNIEVSTPFPKTRFLGPQVVANLKASAVKSMLMSLFFILGYIWLRFKDVKYGVAATVALVHDVLVALGVTVAFNMLGLVNVPISLNVIAAFLTIIGYSLNDTIVVFDRIRENLGNTKGTFGEIVNRSINQTLSRTILTSVTTFGVILAVFAANYGIESPLEGLAFTLLIGVVVGTYSSIFVASPVLIWLHNRDRKNNGTAPVTKALATS